MNIKLEKIGYSILSVVLISILAFVLYQNELAALINVEKQEHYGIINNSDFNGSVMVNKKHFYFMLKGKSLDSSGKTTINFESGKWSRSLFNDTIKFFPRSNFNDSVRTLVIAGDSLLYISTQQVN